MPREIVTSSPGLAFRSPSASSCCQVWSLSRVNSSRPFSAELMRAICAETLGRSFGRMPALTSRSLMAPDCRPNVRRGSSAAAAAEEVATSGGDATAARGGALEVIEDAAEDEEDAAALPGCGTDDAPGVLVAEECVAAAARAADSRSKQARRLTLSTTPRHASMALTGGSSAQHGHPITRKTAMSNAGLCSFIH